MNLRIVPIATRKKKLVRNSHDWCSRNPSWRRMNRNASLRSTSNKNQTEWSVENHWNARMCWTSSSNRNSSPMTTRFRTTRLFRSYSASSMKTNSGRSSLSQNELIPSSCRSSCDADPRANLDNSTILSRQQTLRPRSYSSSCTSSPRLTPTSTLSMHCTIHSALWTISTALWTGK